jgi:hypothetical protein
VKRILFLAAIAVVLFVIWYYFHYGVIYD